MQNSKFKMQNAEFKMQNAECKIFNPQFSINPAMQAFPPCGSAKCASTLCSRSAASVLNPQFSILNSQFSHYSLLQHCTGNLQETCDICTLNIVDVVALIARLNARLVDRLHDVV